MGRSLRQQLLFFSAVALIFLIVSSVPYLYGYLSCPQDKEYMGLAGRDVPGAYMYFMWQAQASQGTILLTNRLTPEKHSAFYFNPEWLLLGRVQGVVGLSLAESFQLERCLTIVLAFCILYYFLSNFFPEIGQRQWVFLWVIFTSGLGWIFWSIGQQPGHTWSVRLWDIEGINLFGYLINKPHFIRSLSLVCLSYAFLLRGEQSGHRIYFLLSGITIAVQGLVRPYDLPTAFLLLTLFPLILCAQEGRFSLHRTINYAIAALAALPVGCYYLYLSKNSVLGQIFKGVDLPALTPLELVIWLGAPFLLAAAAYDGIRNFRKWSPPLTFLYLWGFIVGSLIYAYPIIPWGMESAGLCYIMAPILAGLFLFNYMPPLFSRIQLWRPAKVFLPWLGKRQVATIGLLAVFICLPSNFVLMHRMIQDLSDHSYPYYLPKEVTAAFNWLAENTSSSDIVVSSPEYGFFLPALAGVTCFVGHRDFTIDYDNKCELSSGFFDPSGDIRSRTELLKKYDVRYVLCVGTECDFAERKNSGPFLEPVFANPTATIFRVEREKL